MKINQECIRDILNYLVENLSIEIEETRGSYCSISVLELIHKFEEKYEKEDIVYSINILSECYFIEGKELEKKTQIIFAMQEIYNITYRGQQFYEATKPENIWSKTKSIVSKVGIHSLEFIESIAHDVAVESAKQAITIMMNQK